VSLALYMDHHMDERIVASLRRRGLDVLTARDDQAARWEDERLLERVTALDRVFCTEDEDFFRIAGDWWRQGREFAGVIHVDQDGASIGQLIEDIALIAEAHTSEEMQNRVVYVPM
jgi:hypothetical protein